MADGQMSTLELFQKSLEIYNYERTEAKGDPTKLAAADKRLYTALRNAKVSEDTINSFARFISTMPEKETEMISAMIEATKGRITRVQDLQRDQASLMMSIHARPEQAKAGIASFATTISTILRYFGMDEWAEKIDETSQKIMDSVNVKLKTNGITNANEEIKGLMDRVGNTYRDSDVMERTAEKSKDAPSNLPTPADALLEGNTPQHRQTKSSWGAYEDAFREIGLTSTEIEQVKAPWAKYSGMSPSGRGAILDNGAEITTFMSSTEVRALGPDKWKKVDAAVKELALELN